MLEAIGDESRNGNGRHRYLVILQAFFRGIVAGTFVGSTDKAKS